MDILEVEFGDVIKLVLESKYQDEDDIHTICIKNAKKFTEDLSG
jgi:hypothetical protein